MILPTRFIPEAISIASASAVEASYRGVRRVHRGEAGDHRLVLEDRLQRALADLGLVGSVGGVELASREDVPHGSGYVPVIDAASEETGHLRGGAVSRGEGAQPGGDLGLAHRGTDVEDSVDAKPFIYRFEQLFERGDPRLHEHLEPVAVSVLNVAHRTSLLLSLSHPAHRGTLNTLRS